MSATQKTDNPLKESRKRLTYVNLRLEELKKEMEELKTERTSLRSTLKTNKQAKSGSED